MPSPSDHESRLLAVINSPDATIRELEEYEDRIVEYCNNEPDGIECLSRLLQSTSSEVRSAAIGIAGRVERDKLKIESMLGHVIGNDNETPENRASAIYVLSALETPSARDRIIALLDHPEAQIRRTAVDSVSKLSNVPAGAVGRILGVAGEDDARTRRAAISSLRSIGPPILPVLREQVFSRRGSAQSRAGAMSVILSLDNSEYPGLRRAVIELLDGEERPAAATILEGLVDQEITDDILGPHLERLLDTGDPRILRVVLQAISQQTDLAHRLLPKLLRVGRPSDQMTYVALLEAAGSAGKNLLEAGEGQDRMNGVLQFVVPALYDDDPIVQSAAVECVAAMGHLASGAIDHLRKIRSDENKDQVDAAIRRIR